MGCVERDRERARCAERAVCTRALARAYACANHTYARICTRAHRDTRAPHSHVANAHIVDLMTRSPPEKILKSNAWPLPPHQKFQRSPSLAGSHHPRRPKASDIRTDSLPFRTQYLKVPFRSFVIRVTAQHASTTSSCCHAHRLVGLLVRMQP